MRGRGALLLTAAALAAALALFLQRERLIVGSIDLGGFPLDDSWIHFQFARNLASGHGFAYNPDVPVAGSTAPLWTLLLAGMFKIGGAHPAWAKLAGVVAALGAAWAARWLALLWTGDAMLGLTAALATAWSAPIVWGALSGMEVTLAAALVTGALAAHTAGRVVVSAALVGLAALARPESVLLIPLLWLGGPLTLSRTAIVWGVPSAILAPWIAFNLRTAGTPLPATAAAKIEGGLVGFLSGAGEPLATTLLWRPWQFEREWIGWLASINLLLPVLIVPGLWVLWRRGGRYWVWPASILLVHPIGMALIAPYRGPAFQEGRYSIHLLPLAIVVAVSALAPLVWTARIQPAWGRIACALLLVASLAPLAAGATRYAWAVQNIDAMQVALGRWVEAQTPAHARLALNDVGAITYLGRREVIDVMGLVTPAIIPYRREGEPGVLRYLEQACPDYLIVFPEWFPSLSARADLFTPVHRVKLDHNTVAGADEMVVYETAWNRWRAAPAACPVTAAAGNSAGGGGGSLRGPRLYDVASQGKYPSGQDRRDPGEGRRDTLEGQSSGLRLAPSPGAPRSNGILRRRRRPRVDKREQEHRPRGSHDLPSERIGMRFVGIDVGAERHVVAVVDAVQAVVLKPTGFTEDAGGYRQMLTLLGPATDTLVAMEATGHYWKNLFAVLVTHGFAVALLNPLRTRRFAAEELQRTKTDAIDALGIARFAAQKQPAASRLPDAATEDLRERLRYRDRLSQDFGDRERQLHRLLDLGFPEFPRYVRDVGSELATTILRHYPTAAGFQGVTVRRLAGLRYAHNQPVGRELAGALLTAAAVSVGQHHGVVYRIQVQDICEDLDVLRRRLRTLDRDIERLLERHEVGTLLTTIDGIGPQTAARLVATFGDFRGIRSGAALASYVGAIPGLRQSGQRTSARAHLTPLGAARLRAKLYMPVLSAVRCNPWLRAYYAALIARGKLPKVALIAAMRKLLHAVYSVATHRRPFVPHLAAQEGRP